MYTYSQFVQALANMLVIDSDNAEYLAAIPSIIDDAENRIYRELDILNTVVRDTGGTLTANSRNFTLPQTNGRFVVTNGMNIFTPVSTMSVRKQLVPVTRDWLDAVWGNEMAPSSPSVPDYYAWISDQDFIVGPAPDAGYTMEVIGTIRPTPLSATNTTTYLSLYLSDLFFTASLIFGYGFLKDYGATTDDPNAPGSWEAHYQKTLPSANVEEQRKRYSSMAWTSYSPSIIATPPRV